jgi:hypothetical protein
MSLKRKAALVGMIVIASALAYGSSTSSAEPGSSVEFRQNDSQLNSNNFAKSIQYSSPFRSSLQESSRTGKSNRGILIADLSDSRLAEPTREQGQDVPLSLPEPASWILVISGLLAILIRNDEINFVKLKDSAKTSSQPAAADPLCFELD